MTSAKSSLVLSILLLFAVALPSAACGPWYYSPKYYMMYRAVSTAGWSDEETQNCHAWRDITSPIISVEDIHEVVYKYPIVCVKILTTGIHDSNNSFARWIAQNKRTDIIDYLVLAKQYEKMCDDMESAWYYPGAEGEITAEYLLQRSKEYAGGVLQDRYHLLHIRAQMVLGQDSTLVAFYDSIAPGIEHEVLRKMMTCYVRGACKNLDWTERAEQYRGEERYGNMLAQYAKKIKHYEAWGDTGYPEDKNLQPNVPMYPNFPDSLSSEMLNTARHVAERGLTKHVAVWFYTAAYIADMRGETKEASRLLSRAEQAPHDDYLDESLRVMRIYLDAKRSHYDEAYWERLHWQLVWLKEKIENNLTPDVVYRTIHCSGSYLDINQSYYYWNDMLRRILLGEICPRLRQQGQTTRALQLANVADNLLRKICVERYEEYPLTENDEEYEHMLWKDEWMSSKVEEVMDEGFRPTRLYRVHSYYKHTLRCISDSLLLSHDREFFSMIDNFPARQTEQYYEALSNPKTAFDFFLAQNSLTDKDFFCDLVGTQYLRERNYPAAERWLGKVSPTFQTGYAFTENTNRLPFEAYKTQPKEIANYKHSFAREMCSLEKDIRRETHPDRRGLLLLRYGMGMKNSVDWCWSLTEYGCSELNEPRNRRRAKTLKEAQHIIDRALLTLQSREAKAQAQYKMLNFKAAARYADTPTGQHVLRSCDRLVDYNYARKWMPN